MEQSVRLNQLDKEHQELRARLPHKSQSLQQVSPISEQGFRIQTMFRKPLEYASMLERTRSPDQLLEFAAFLETKSMRLSNVEGADELQELPLSSEAGLFCHSKKTETGELHIDRYFRILHKGLEEIEMLLIKNRIDALRILLSRFKPIINFQPINTPEDWIRSAFQDPSAIEAQEIPLLDGSSFPEFLKGKSMQDLLEDPFLLQMYAHRRLEHEIGGLIFSTALMRQFYNLQIRDILEGLI